jgi:hypothetical protein
VTKLGFFFITKLAAKTTVTRCEPKSFLMIDRYAKRWRKTSRTVDEQRQSVWSTRTHRGWMNGGISNWATGIYFFSTADIIIFMILFRFAGRQKIKRGARIKRNGSQTILFWLFSIIGGSALFLSAGTHFSAHLLIDDLLFCQRKTLLRAKGRHSVLIIDSLGTGAR